MPRSPSAKRTNSTAPVPVIRKHHGLVRLSHWVNVPLLLGLIATGLSIYWAAPVFKHAPHPVSGSR
jgi:cytochrome b subunit of formate dehydrogenase